METQSKIRERVKGTSSQARSGNRTKTESLRLLSNSMHTGINENILSYAQSYSHKNKQSQICFKYCIIIDAASASQAEGRGFDPHLPLQ
jgi:hypothetical protein